MIKVALIYPPYSNDNYAFFSLAYLIGGLRKNFEKDPSVEFKLFDCPAMNLSYKDLEKQVKEYKPDIFGISIPFTVMLKPALKLIEMAKKDFPNSWIVTGGTHATLCAEDVYKVSDYTVLGEGVEPMTKIIEYFKTGKKGYNMSGVVYNDNGKMARTIRKDTQKINSDKMGSPDWSDLNLENFLNPIFFGEKEKGFSIFTSKGCPFNCSYCSNQLLWDRRVIYRDLKEVAEEIKYFQKKYDVHNFLLEDDVFTVKKERLHEFCDMLKEYKIKIKWLFQTRPNILPDLDSLKIAKENGCRAVNMGIEGGNENILNINQTTSKDTIIKAVDRIHKSGMMVYAGFIIGFPEDTIETVWDTIKFPDELNIESPGFQLMVPYPATAVRKKAEKDGGILTNDYNKYSTYDVVYCPPGLKGYDLKSIRRFAYTYFHTRNEKRLERFLNRLKGTDDYSIIEEKYIEAFKNKEKYNFDYLKSLIYIKNDQKIGNQELIQRLPLI